MLVTDPLLSFPFKRTECCLITLGAKTLDNNVFAIYFGNDFNTVCTRFIRLPSVKHIANLVRDTQICKFQELYY